MTLMASKARSVQRQPVTEEAAGDGAKLAPTQTDFQRDSGEGRGAVFEGNKIMTDWKAGIEEALKDFVAVASLARAPVGPEDHQVEYLEAPHTPPRHLPAGKIAVYGFWHDGEWLKIGMAGPKSNARYTSHHYNPNSAGSTLAASLVADPRMSGWPGFNPSAPGGWIKSATNRVNILLDSRHGMLLAALLESYLHVRLKPRYEK
jgi:hypothetical protein